MLEIDKEKEYDVIVVGAGPAGLASAKSCIENSLKVLVVEEHSAIGTPVQCGEVFHSYLLKELELELDRAQIVANEPQALKIYSPNREIAEIRLAENARAPLVIVDRKVLEKKLAVKISNKGAKIITKARAVGILKEHQYVRGVKILHFGTEYAIKSKLVIACDGPNSGIARYAGMDIYRDIEKFDSCIQFQMANIDVDEKIAEIYLGSNYARGGYVWLLPKGKNYANVGLGVNCKLGNQALRYLNEFVSKDKSLRHGSIIEINAGIVPLGGAADKLVSDGLMVVGDAARQVNPATGGGMVFAIKAGLAAGRTAALAIKEKDYSRRFLETYEKSWKQEIGKYFRGFSKLKETILKFSDKELDELIGSIGILTLPSYEEPWYPAVKHVLGALIKNPRLAFKLATLTPYFL